MENLVSRCGKIKVSYLPKNTTSEIQPLDQGIISVFKQNYRHKMIKQMVADNNTPIDTSLAWLNLKEVCHLSGKAWDAIAARCIERCWLKGLGPAFPSSTHDDGNDDEPEFTRFIEDDVRLAEEALREYEHSHHDILNWFQQMTSAPYMNTSQMTKLSQMSAGRMKLHHQSPKPVAVMTTTTMMAPQLPHQKCPRQ
ncbi:unnamed protein product [Lepidochelys olivacea]